MALSEHTTTLSAASSATASFSHDSGTGSNRLLMLWATTLVDNTGSGITAVTYNSVSLTNVTGASLEVAFGGRFGETQLWYLIAPATGSNTVAITYSVGGDVQSACFAATALEGAHQTVPVSATVVNTNSGSSDTTSFTETTGSANSWLVMCGNWQGGDTDPFAPGSGDTELADQASGANTFLDHGHTVLYQSTTTAGSYTVATTATASDNFVAGAAEIIEATAATVVKDMIGGGIIAFPR